MENTWIGKYKILGTLGSGAMGIVYKGYDETIKRPVAVKVLHEQHRQGEQGIELELRFKQEAQAAARCLHPNIVAIFEYGVVPAGAPFIVMEYVEGVELKRYLAGRQAELSIAQSVAIIKQVLAALDYAHHHGVVHRDIKPSNIIILGDDQVKVMDFGVARLDSSDLTLAGHMVGTPSYMSPEGLRGAKVDGRSDLYTTGVVLLELLTGEKIKLGEEASSRVSQLLAASIPPHPIRDAIEEVIVKSVALKPSDRYQRAAEFLQALDAAMLAGPDYSEDERTDYTRTVVVQRRVEESPTRGSGGGQETLLRRDSQRADRSASTRTDRSIGTSVAFTAETISTIEKSLATYIGPLAKVLIKRSLRSTYTLNEFTHSLANNIPDEGERKQFIHNLKHSEVHKTLEEELSRFGLDEHSSLPSGSSSSSSSSSSASASREPLVKPFKPEDLNRFTQKLTYYVGPLARRYVKSAAKRSHSITDLKSQLAETIPNSQERQAFLDSLSD